MSNDTIGNRLYTLIYTDGSHEDAIRAISLWRSARNEVKRFNIFLAVNDEDF